VLARVPAGRLEGPSDDEAPGSTAAGADGNSGATGATAGEATPDGRCARGPTGSALRRAGDSERPRRRADFEHRPDRKRGADRHSDMPAVTRIRAPATDRSRHSPK